MAPTRRRLDSLSQSRQGDLAVTTNGDADVANPLVHSGAYQRLAQDSADDSDHRSAGAGPRRYGLGAHDRTCRCRPV